MSKFTEQRLSFAKGNSADLIDYKRRRTWQCGASFHNRRWMRGKINWFTFRYTPTQTIKVYTHICPFSLVLMVKSIDFFHSRSLWSSIMKTSILCLLLLSQLLLGCVALEFDTFTGMRCDTCGIMCGKFCGNRIFKACCYSHNKRSASVHIDTNGKATLVNKLRSLNLWKLFFHFYNWFGWLLALQNPISIKTWFGCWILHRKRCNRLIRHKIWNPYSVLWIRNPGSWDKVIRWRPKKNLTFHRWFLNSLQVRRFHFFARLRFIAMKLLP